MQTYRNKVTGKTVTVTSKLGGDWELITQSQPKKEVAENKPEKEVKPIKKTKKK